MKSFLLAATFILTTAIVRADDPAPTPTATESKPAASAPASSAKKKAMAAKKHKASKKPVEKTTLEVPVPKEERKLTVNQNLQEWLAKMKKRVSSARSKQSKLVAVAAVRGDEKSDPAPLYWKGKEGDKQVNAAEIEEFDAAVETAATGDIANAKIKLQQFIDAHPKSPLVADAQETINKMTTSDPEPDQPDPTTAP
jgi:TolA-binding protein